MRMFLLLALLASASAQSDTDPGAALTQAHEQSDLRKGGPFVLEANISAVQGKNKAEGKYRLIWIAKDKWREDVIVGPDFLNELTVNGQHFWKYSSQQAEFLLAPFQNIGTYPEFQPPSEAKIELESKKKDGEKLDCLHFKRKALPDSTLCVNQRGLLVTFNDIRYADFRDALTMKFPYAMKAEIGGVEYSSMIESLQRVGEVPAELFTADGTWRSGPACTTGPVKPAKLISSVRPDYPTLARQMHAQGAVEIHATIDEHGDVVNATAVSGHPMLRDAALAAVKQWKYEPTSCNGVNVPFESDIMVTFSVR